MVLSSAIASLATRVMRTRAGRFGIAILAVLTAIALFAPLLVSEGNFSSRAASLLEPSAQYWFGTDNTGRDLFALVMLGTRTSLAIGFLSAFFALLLGALIGAVAGYFGGLTATLLMRVVELFQTLPVIIVVLFITAQYGSGFWLLIFCVALVIWPLEARIVFGQVKYFRNREFVMAAEAAGFSTVHIVVREILPNALPPVIIQVALDASAAIMIESGLGFLGLTDPSVASWGALLNLAQNYLANAWWMSVFPGAAIALAVLGLNLFADGLNDSTRVN